MAKNLQRLARQGDGIEYNPQLLGEDLETICENLDARRQQDDVHLALQRQRDQYRQELQDYVEFNRKVKRDLPQAESGKQKRAEQARLTSQRDRAKAMQIYQDKIQEGLQTEERAMQLKIRDDEANYIRAM